jgi:uncharacterized HAD superfamily protein
MTIAFDLDDILASFQLGWIAYNNTHYGTALTYEGITEYNYGVLMNLPMPEVFRRIDEFWHSDSFLEIMPTPGSLNLISSLQGTHKLFVLTSRSLDIKDKTENWIHQYFPGCFSEILMTGHITKNGLNASVSKADLCKKHGIALLVDDAPAYVENVAKEGIKAALIEKPWNRSYTFEHENIIRLKTLPEVISLIK